MIPETGKFYGILREMADIPLWEKGFKLLPEFVFLIDSDRRILDYSPLIESKLRLREEEIKGRPCYEIFHPSKEPPDFCPLNRGFPGKGEIVFGETQLRGETNRVFVFPVKEGVYLHLSYNITEKEKELEHAVISQIISGETLVGAYIFQNGKFKYVNPALASLFGYTIEELVDRLGPLDLTAQEDKDRVYEETRKRLRGERDYSHYTFKGLRKDGTTFDCEVLGKRVVYRGKPAIAGVLLDITRIRQMEESLRKAQRLEALGTLVGGIAHDFNNFLTGILGFTQLLLEELSPQSLSWEKAKRIQDIARQASHIVSRLLAFSRRQVLNPRPVNLNQVVVEMTDLLRNTLEKNIRIEVSLSSPLWMIQADPTSLEDIIMNLCLNARDAMPKGGELLIRTDNILADDKFIESHPEMKPGRYVRLRVKDTGVGMSRDIISRIFEPFFTTKPPRKGTGLGLSMVYGMVKQHDGYIFVESEVGKGACFDIYFPALEKKIKERKGEKEGIKKITIRGTVFLIEDEENIREFIQESLKRCGFRVISSSSPREALKLWEEVKDEVDILLADLMLPESDGWELYSRLKKEKPGLRALFITGYPPSSEKFPIPSSRILLKPFTLERLLEKLEETLLNS